MAETQETYVYIWLGGAAVPAGRLSMVSDGRGSHAIFRYGRRYLERSDRVTLDPVALPLPAPGEVQLFHTPEGFDLFNGIRDAAPDGWGRHVIDREAGSRPLSEYDYLTASGDHRVGALAFGPDLSGPRRMMPWGKDTPRDEPFSLEEMLKAAEHLEREETLPLKHRQFFVRGSSLGGARPKGAAEWRAEPWIAKFGRADDRYNMCRAEYAIMRLAAECGLDVPPVDVTSVFQKDVYLIRRFDRQQVEAGVDHRVPFISGLTLLGAHEMEAHRRSYADLADALRQHGTRPRQDMRELYRRMVFNILCNNTDDHLRNHGFLWDEQGWRLSPLYDVLPFPETAVERRLALGVGDKGREATLSNALSRCQSFGVNRQEAERIISNLQEQIRQRWEPLLAECGVTYRDRVRLASCFHAVEEVFTT